MAAARVEARELRGDLPGLVPGDVADPEGLLHHAGNASATASRAPSNPTSVTHPRPGENTPWLPFALRGIAFSPGDVRAVRR